MPNSTSDKLVCNCCAREVDLTNIKDQDDMDTFNLFQFIQLIQFKFAHPHKNDGMIGNCKLCGDCVNMFVSTFKIQMDLVPYNIFEDNMKGGDKA